jgi:hypothetical protein
MRAITCALMISGCDAGAPTPHVTKSNVGSQAAVGSRAAVGSQPDASSETVAGSQVDVFTITQTSFGPIRGSSDISRDLEPGLDAVRAMFRGYDVTEDDDPESVQYDVSLRGERLLFIWPLTPPADDGPSAIMVHAVSPKIRVAGRDWRVGGTFRGGDEIMRCECWIHELMCFSPGDHIAVSFAHDCGQLVDGVHHARELSGLAINRITWRPTPFGRK